MKLKSVAKKVSYVLSTHLLQGWQVGQRPILILGHGRSGTSWVGNIFSQVRRVIYYYEPTSPVVTGKGDFETWFRYLRPDVRDPLFEEAFDATFMGLAYGHGWHRGYWARPFPGYQIVVKDVASLMAVEWLAERYDPRIILLLRHPCATILSDLKQGTPPARSRETLLAQNELFEDHLEPYRSLIEQAETPLEILAAIWAARHRVIADAWAGHPEWHVIFYEALCAEPVAEFKEAFKQMGVSWSPRLERFVEESSTTHVPGQYARRRISTDQIDKWRRQMTPAEIASVRRYVQPFKLPFYQSDDDW